VGEIGSGVMENERKTEKELLVELAELKARL